MSVKTPHPDYLELSKRCQYVDDTLNPFAMDSSEEDTYVPMTGGMAAMVLSGEAEKVKYGKNRFLAYKKRAYYPDFPSRLESVLLGLIFKNDPVGNKDEVVSADGRTVLDIARELCLYTARHSRAYLVVDLPDSNNGNEKPCISVYRAKTMINWHKDKQGRLIKAVAQEYDNPNTVDEFDLGEVRAIYRVFEPHRVRVLLEDGSAVGEPEYLIKTGGFMPVIPVGTISNTLTVQPSLIYPASALAVKCYVADAEFAMGNHYAAHPTLYQSGVPAEQYELNTKIGAGSGASWHLGEDGQGRAGYIETNGAGLSSLESRSLWLFGQAERIARQAISGSTNETATAAMSRNDTQNASAYSLADCVSAAIRQALMVRATWGNLPKDPELLDFSINTDWSESQIDSSVITAIGSRVNAGGYPASAEYEYARRAKLFTGTLEDWQTEIESAPMPQAAALNGV